MSLPRCCLILAMLALASVAPRADILDLSGHRWSFVGEAGLLWTPLMDIHGFNQSNATAGWNTLSPTLRAEAWLGRSDALNLGVVLQPGALTYRDTIASRLDYRGSVFLPGQAAKLSYDYNSVRLTANYDVWPGEATTLRLGASLLLRAVELELSSPTARVRRTDFVAAPLLNIEAGARLDTAFSLVARADLFPALRGAGFYDVFAGVRYALEGGRAFEFGGRTFLGGYLPEQIDQFANRIIWQSVVARFVF